MEKRFVVPAVTFLSGLVLWIAFFVATLTSGWMQNQSPWFGAAVCLVVGVVLFVSASRCRAAGGPGYGGAVRGGALLLFSALTFWKAGVLAGGILAAAALAVFVVVVCAGSVSVDES